MALEPLSGPLIDTKIFYRYMELFSESYEKIINGKPVTCSVSKKEIEPAMHPEALIMDVSLRVITSWGAHCLIQFSSSAFPPWNLSVKSARSRLRFMHGCLDRLPSWFTLLHPSISGAEATFALRSWNRSQRGSPSKMLPTRWVIIDPKNARVIRSHHFRCFIFQPVNLWKPLVYRQCMITN